MIAPSDSPLASATTESIAKALFDEAMLGGPDEVECDDPVVWALWWELRQWMLGACALLATHLSSTRGHPVVLLECRKPGQPWHLRHAAVTPLPHEDAAALILSGGGWVMPVVDAAGGGTFEARSGLYIYPDEDYEYRVILASDPDCSYGRWYDFRSDRPFPDIEYVIGRLPGLALALAEPFDLRSAVAAIVADGEGPGRKMKAEVEASGMAEWTRQAPAPAS